MPGDPTYISLVQKVKALTDYFYSLDRTDGRVVENANNIFAKATEAAMIIKVVPAAEPEQFNSIITDANAAFQKMFGLAPEQYLNQSISVIESIKGIKFFDWNNITRDIANGKGHGIFDFYVPQLDKWLKFTTVTPEVGSLIVLISDITEVRRSLTPIYVKLQGESAKESAD